MNIFLPPFALLAFAADLPASTVARLRCEYEQNPAGIDALQPQLGWNLNSAVRGDRQTAYQVLAASSTRLLNENRGDLWDSGKVASDESVHVPYAGSQLTSREECFWKVRIWDQAGQPSDWSPTASWTMGLLQSSDWTAQWITASRWYTPTALRPPGLIVAPGGWADVDLGAEFPIDSILLYFSDPATAPKRFKILGADELQFLHPQVLVDNSGADYHPNGTGPQEFVLHGVKVRRIRLWITDPSNPTAPQSWPVHDGPVDSPSQFTVRQMEVMSGGKNVALMRPTRELGTQWNSGHTVFLVDGMPSAGDGDEAPADACPTPTAPLLRKAFNVSKPVRRATLYVAALGMADVTINGRPVTDDVLGPPFTDYTHRTVYLTRDVTQLVNAGENVIGVTLGNGFFNPPSRGFGERHGGNGPPRALLQTEIEFVDGSRRVINSDASWKWSRSEITSNDVFTEYTEDRHAAKPGWDLPHYDDADWRGVAVTTSLGGKLAARLGPPIRVVDELKADRVEGNHAYFKTLTAGWPQVKINGHAGQVIKLVGHAPAYDAPPLTFVLAADGPAVLQPRFMYLSGPLDLEVQGLTEPLAAEAATIQVAHADLKPAGTFATSNPWLNELHDVDLRTHLNYDGDQPMDPMREKEGWTQDAQNMFETAAYLTDVAGFYRKWSQDFADGQDESGYLSSVLPLVGRQEYGWNSPWWSGVVVLLPWQHYQFYGDRRLLAERYESMRRYVDFLSRLTASGSVRSWDDYPYVNTGNPDSPEAKAGILSWLGAGDWQNPFGNRLVVPAPLMDMPAWSYYASIVSQTATVLGKTDDARKYAALAAQVKDRFNRLYLNPVTGLYNNQADCQTTQVLPLALGLVPPEQRALTHERLIEAIHGRKDHHGTSFVSLPCLLHVLIDSRETALANKIVNQQDFPGWKTLMHDGVFAEGWDGSNAQMPSCGGAIGLWLYQSVLGIIPDPAGPGFKQFIIAPQPDPASGLTWARGSYESIHGTIVSDWKIEGGLFTLRAAIPANTTATVLVPTANLDSVRESGQPAGRSGNVEFLRLENGTAVYAVGSGTYTFTADATVAKTK
jgi:alpha-L-rhamnosidase